MKLTSFPTISTTQISQAPRHPDKQTNSQSLSDSIISADPTSTSQLPPKRWKISENRSITTGPTPFRVVFRRSLVSEPHLSPPSKPFGPSTYLHRHSLQLQLIPSFLRYNNWISAHKFWSTSFVQRGGVYERERNHIV